LGVRARINAVNFVHYGEQRATPPIFGPLLGRSQMATTLRYSYLYPLHEAAERVGARRHRRQMRRSREAAKG